MGESDVTTWVGNKDFPRNFPPIPEFSFSVFGPTIDRDACYRRFKLPLVGEKEEGTERR